MTCPTGPDADDVAAGAGLVIDGGFQECRGADIGNNEFYVENIEEEQVRSHSLCALCCSLLLDFGSRWLAFARLLRLQDDPREWFLKADGAAASTLRYIPPAGVSVNNPETAVVGAVLKRVIEVEGAVGVTLRGLTITATAPTFLDSYECPSGGDWSIHRGAAVFVEGSSDITIEGLTFDQVEATSSLALVNAE